MLVVERYIDNEAEFWWAGLEFWVETNVPQPQLVPQILARIEALPLFTPWNASCGISIDKQNGSTSYSKPIEQIMRSDSWRTRSIRRLIPQFRDLIEVAKAFGKNGYSYPKDRDKETFILRCLSSVTDPDWQAWINSVVVPVTSYGETTIKYPKLLGTMGNIGSIDIAENYHTAFGILFDSKGNPTKIAQACFEQTIFDFPSEQKIQSTEVKGLHLFPAMDFNLDRARSQNYDYPPSGVGSTSSINPAASLLAILGLIAFEGVCVPLSPEDSVTRKVAKYSLAVPTTGSSIDLVTLDERKNLCEEYFLPLWTQPHSYKSLRTNLFQCPAISDQEFILNQQIYDGTDYISLLRSWAIDQGLECRFLRYALLTRKSKSENFAILLEILTFSGEGAKTYPIDLAADLNKFRLDVRALARSPLTTNVAQREFYNFDQLFGSFVTGKTSHSAILLALGQVAKHVKPPQLRFEWLEAIIEESNCVELRLALSIASCGVNADTRIFLSADPVSLLLETQLNWGNLAQIGKPYYSASPRIFASLADVHIFIQGDNFNDVKFNRWISALRSINFNSIRKLALKNSDHFLTASRLPVSFKIAALHLKHFYYRQSPVARVAYGGDLTLQLNQLRGAGIFCPPSLSRNFAASRRIASALAFPIGNYQNKLLVKSLQVNTSPKF